MLYMEDMDEEGLWRKFIVTGFSNASDLAITVASTFVVPIPFINTVVGWISKEIAELIISSYHQSCLVPSQAAVCR